jgi:hypothetical protein
MGDLDGTGSLDDGDRRWSDDPLNGRVPQQGLRLGEALVRHVVAIGNLD